MTEVKFSIKTKTPLHIGGGRQTAFIDQTVFKIGDKPAIPGSAIKGRVRSIYEEEWRRRLTKCYSPVELAKKMREILEEAMEELEQYVPGLASDFKRFAPDPEEEPYAYFPLVCDPLSELHCNPPEAVSDFGEDVRETIRLIASFILLRRSATKHYCPACTYFGGNGHPSPLIFKAAESNTTQLGVITRVSIDRYTGAAKQERLFSIEYVPPDVEFKGSVELAEEVSQYVDRAEAEEFLNEVVPGLLERVKQIGKFKSVGFGVVEVKVDAKNGDTEEKVDAHIRREAMRRLCDDEELKGYLKNYIKRASEKYADAIAEVIIKYRERVRREVWWLLGP